MAQETPAEAIARKAKEADAKKAAEAAQAKADAAAAQNEKVAESRARQEREEAEADNAARIENAKALAASNSGLAASVGLSPVTPNAAGNPEPVPSVQAAPIEKVAVAVAPGRSEWRTFQHQYANAGTNLPNGQRLVFGGQNGHTGQYSTNVPERSRSWWNSRRLLAAW